MLQQKSAGNLDKLRLGADVAKLRKPKAYRFAVRVHANTSAA